MLESHSCSTERYSPVSPSWSLAPSPSLFPSCVLGAHAPLIRPPCSLWSWQPPTSCRPAAVQEAEDRSLQDAGTSLPWCLVPSTGEAYDPPGQETLEALSGSDVVGSVGVGARQAHSKPLWWPHFQDRPREVGAVFAQGLPLVWGGGGGRLLVSEARRAPTLVCGPQAHGSTGFLSSQLVHGTEA